MNLEEIKDYLRIDDSFDDVFLTQLIDTSQIYIDSMVGDYYQVDENAVKLAKIAQYKLIADMYTIRSTYLDDKSKQDRIVTSILDKLSNYTEVV